MVKNEYFGKKYNDLHEILTCPKKAHKTSDCYNNNLKVVLNVMLKSQ